MAKKIVKEGWAKSPFETAFVKEVMSNVDVQDFDDMCKVIGLKMGTDVWINNASVLLENGVCSFKDIIGCREDVTEYLENFGLSLKLREKIAKEVAEGRLSEQSVKVMEKQHVPDWYIDSCKKIKYLVTREVATKIAHEGYPVGC